MTKKENTAFARYEAPQAQIYGYETLEVLASSLSGGFQADGVEDDDDPTWY